MTTPDQQPQDPSGMLNQLTGQASEHASDNSILLATLALEHPEQTGFTDGSHPEPSLVPTKFDNLVWSLGWTDGRLAGPVSTANNESFFSNQAELWIATKNVDIAAQRASRAIACDALEKEWSVRQDELRKLRDMQKEVADMSLRHNHKFSIGMAVILFAFGLLLLIADIPLTTQLATKSLGFNDALCIDPANGTTTVFDPIRGCDPPRQIQRVESGSLSFQGLAYFPDVLVLAFALASCSFVVKLLMDAAMHGHIAWKSRHFPRALMIIAVFVLFLGLLVDLGMVRYGAFKAETDVLLAQRTSFENRRTKLEADQTANADAIQRVNSLIDQWNAKVTGRQTGPIQLGFILLTILFPLVSGILFHFGVQNLHYWHAARKAPVDTEAAERHVEEANGKVLAEKKEIARLDAMLSVLQDQSTTARISKQWANLYDHGKRRGEQSRDTYDSALSLFDKALQTVSRKTTNDYATSK